MPLLLLLASAWAADLPPLDRPGEVLPDRHWDFRHLHLSVRIDPAARAVQGTATHTVAPLGMPTGWLRLHQVGLDIASVTVDGAPVEGWRLGEQTLDIPVPPRSGERTVAVTWSATPETGLHFRAPEWGDGTVQAWSQGEGEDHRHWFPGWDHPSDRFTFSSDVTVPDGLSAFANGVLTGKAPADPGWTTWSYRFDHELVNYLVAVAVGEYDVYTDEGVVPLEYVVPRTETEATARRSLEAAGPQLAFLGDLLGAPYPYPVYRQVVVERFLYSGMENTGITFLGDKLMLRDEAWRPEWTEVVVAHEAAHQWFGDLLTTYGWRELWLNEGFATYYAHRWMEAQHGPEYAAVGVAGRRASGIAGDDLPMAPRGWSRVDGHDNTRVYVRGATVLHALEALMGRQVFDEAIRRYVADNRDRLVETADLRRALEDASGMHLGWFFDATVHGTGFPKAKSSWKWAGGSLAVELSQASERPSALFVDVEIGTAGDVLTRRVWLDGPETRLTLDLEAPPLWVAVDPHGTTLAHWTHAQEPVAWVAQLRHSPSPVARLTAMAQLGDGKATPDAIAALRESLLDPKLHPKFRAKAAAPLGALASPAAVEALLAGVGTDDGIVREAAVDALAKAVPDPGLLDRLEALTRDADPIIRASALQVLAKHDSDRALPLARKRLGRPDTSQGHAEHGVALGVIGDHGGAKDMKPLLDRLATGTPHPVRTRAAQAADKLVGRVDDDKLRGRLSDALLPWLDDPDLRVVGASIPILGRVGDDRAEATLRAWAKRTNLPLGETASDAAAKIRARANPAPRPAPEAEDPERLEDRLEALEKRLERVEEWR